MLDERKTTMVFLPAFFDIPCKKKQQQKLYYQVQFLHFLLICSDISIPASFVELKHATNQYKSSIT